MFKLITKADIALFVILMVIGFTLSWFSLFGSSKGQWAIVTVSGERYGTYKLSENRTITIKNHNYINKFSIKNGQVQMVCANCKNQVCVHEKPIKRAGQTIVCLPNKVVIEIKGGDGYDAISK